MKKFIHLGLSLLLISPVAQAQAPGQNLEAAYAPLSAEVIPQLTSPLRPFAGIEAFKNTTERETRIGISSSFFFKSLLRNTEEAMLSYKKYGAAVKIDPSMSLEDLDAKIKAQENHVCNQSLNSLPGGMDELLTTIMFQLVRGEDKLKNLSAQEKKQTSAAEQAKLLRLVEAHVAGSPSSSNGKTVARLLGQPTKIDFFGNKVRRIHFTRTDEKGEKKSLPVSLSMLTSFRSGRDEAFVKVQSCLVEYLQAQQNVFSERLIEIEKNNSKKASMAMFADMNLQGKKTSSVHFGVLSKKQDKVYRLKHFYEGQEFADLEKEKDFITKRLVLITANLPYLETRLEGALDAHQLMTQMGSRQMDDLIGSFIQFMRLNEPVATTVAATAPAANSEAFAEAFVYKKQLIEDLTNLSSALQEEKILREATDRDLQNIKSQSGTSTK